MLQISILCEFYSIFAFQSHKMIHNLHTYSILKRRDIMSIVYDTRWDNIWLLKLLLLPFVYSWPRVFPFHEFTYVNRTRLHFLYIYEVSSIQWFSRLLHNKNCHQKLTWIRGLQKEKWVWYMCNEKSIFGLFFIKLLNNLQRN